MKKYLALFLAFAMVFSSVAALADIDVSASTDTKTVTDAVYTPDTWDGTVDTSWYNDTDNEFTITTAEQWAGLAYLVNGAQSFNPALDNDATADFGYYAGEPNGNKSAKPNESAADNSINFEGKTIYLAADLDLCPVDADGNLVKLPGNEQLSMMPVGYSKFTPFKGTFDGQGHTIKNLFQGGWDLYGLDYKNVYLGLFGCVKDATIKNLVVDNFSFNCEINLGAVAGISSGTSTFDNITIKNSTIATGGGWWVGGLIGWAYGNQTIKNINIDETNTIAQVGGHYDTAVGGIIGGCNNVDGESIAINDCYVACKLDVYNDCTANYNTGVYRNCGMVIGGIGESNEVVIDGTKYPDCVSKGVTLTNVEIVIGDWANYTYCWAYELPKNCQRVEPGVGYNGVDFSTLSDYSIDVSRPFNAIFGAENAGDTNNVRGPVTVEVMEFLVNSNYLEATNVTVDDQAYVARTDAEVWAPAPTTFALNTTNDGWVLVDSYATLAEAFAAAQSGYKVKLVKDIEFNDTITIADGVEIILDMNGKKITSTDAKTSNYEIFYNYGTLTVTGNGTIELTALNDRDWNASSSIFHNRGGVLNIENGTFKHLGGTDMAYVIDNSGNWYGDATTNIEDGTLSSTYIAIRNRMEQNSHGASGTAYLNVKGGTISGTSRAIWAQAASLNEAYPATGVINITGGNIGLIDTPRNTGAQSMTNISGDAVVSALKAENGEFSITGGSVGELNILDAEGNALDANDIVIPAITGGTFGVDPTAYLETGYDAIVDTYGMYKVVKAAYTDESVKIEFVKEDEDIAGNDTVEGEDTYLINVVGTNNALNRLNSADLKFTFTKTPFTGAEMDYEILERENSKISVTSHPTDANRYMFSFDTKTDVVDSGNIITIGKVKVTGYGKYSFIVDAAATTNEVHATTQADNVVDTYIPNGDITKGEGNLDISDNTITDIEIKVPVRTLTINIAFPNTISGNDAAYQDMKVEVSGNIDGVQKTVKEGLGMLDANNGYSVAFDNLVLNEAYNVTVSGAGYRTARYTVTMTDSKTLNFWNNVKDTDTVIEIGKNSSAAKVTFLAGDIVKDNIINIYDLSAVVSYFGTIDLKTTNAAYAKYDLNRDNKIDSKDVAYVLVSWGK